MDVSINKPEKMMSGSTSEFMSNFQLNQNSAAINSELSKSPEKLVSIDTRKLCLTKKMLKEGKKLQTKIKRRPKHVK